MPPHTTDVDAQRGMLEGRLGEGPVTRCRHGSWRWAGLGWAEPVLGATGRLRAQLTSYEPSPQAIGQLTALGVGCWRLGRRRAGMESRHSVASSSALGGCGRTLVSLADR